MPESQDIRTELEYKLSQDQESVDNKACDGNRRKGPADPGRHLPSLDDEDPDAEDESKDGEAEDVKNTQFLSAIKNATVSILDAS